MKTLMVFDFDHTVVDDNSDTWVIRCLRDQTLPDSVKSSYQRGHWTDYMGRVMSYLGEQSISPESMRGVMETIPLTDGMTELLTLIADHKVDIDCIVISDSNTLFIDWILQVAGLKPAVDQVFTNPAWFKECGSMVIQKYHSHNCSNCPVNLCKKKVLEDYLSKQLSAGMEYHTICYVGDGGNDLCPTSCLRGSDVVMPRKGYTLEKLLAKQIQDNSLLLKARVFGWTSGIEIVDELKSCVQLS